MLCTPKEELSVQSQVRPIVALEVEIQAGDEAKPVANPTEEVLKGTWIQILNEIYYSRNASSGVHKPSPVKSALP
jgi:hypothetical protein